MCEYEKEGNEIEGEGGGEDEVGVGELVGLLKAWSYFHCVNIATIFFFFFFSTFDFGGPSSIKFVIRIARN